MSLFPPVLLLFVPVAVVLLSAAAPGPRVEVKAKPAAAVEAEALYRSEAASYALRLMAAPSDRALIVVEGRGGYHVNTKYPWKFVATQTYAKDRFALTEASASLELPRSDAKGELRFSVCNATECLLEKVTVGNK